MNARFSNPAVALLRFRAHKSLHAENNLFIMPARLVPHVILCQWCQQQISSFLLSPDAQAVLDRITDTSDPGHFGTNLLRPNCPDISALVPKCPRDSSDLSAELPCPICQNVLPRFWRLRFL